MTRVASFDSFNACVKEGVEITASAKDQRRPMNQYEYPAKAFSRLIGEAQGRGGKARALGCKGRRKRER